MTTSQKSKYEKALEQIEFKIFTNILKPKERLIERELMNEFDVSRASVRKLLKTLEFKHLVKYAPGKGVTVIDYDIKEISDMYHARKLLEAYAMDSVVENITDDMIEKIKVIAKEFEQAVENGDLKSVFKCNGLFHGAIFDTCDNKVVNEMINSLRSRSYYWYQYFTETSKRKKLSIKDHNDMIDCLITRNAKKLKTINNRHLSRGFKSIQDRLNFSDF